MDITNKQHVSDLLAYLTQDMDVAGVNLTKTVLPAPTGAKNSTGEDRINADSWYDEFYNLRKSNPDKLVELDIDGVQLYAFNFDLDNEPVHIVNMEYDTAPSEGVALLPWHCNNENELIDSWLGQTIPADHPKSHPIRDFVRLVRGEDYNFGDEDEEN